MSSFNFLRTCHACIHVRHILGNLCFVGPCNFSIYYFERVVGGEQLLASSLTTSDKRISISPYVIYKTSPTLTHPTFLSLTVRNITTMRHLTPLGMALYPALYPIRGIWFFIVHPAFWGLFKARLIPLLFLSLLVYTLLFMFAFLPQAALLAIFHGPAAFVNAAFLVLGEGEKSIFTFQNSRPSFLQTL
jgi:hypothetical protein